MCARPPGHPPPHWCWCGAKDDMRECDYSERARRCHEPAEVIISIGGRDVGLCAEHRLPKFHPPDLHKRLREARPTETALSANRAADLEE